MEGSGQNLLVLWGMPVRAKAALAATLAHALHTSGRTVTLLDNGDVPVPAAALPPVVRVRLPAGCVCCTLAGRLIPAVAQVHTAAALLVVSAHAQPDLLARVLATLRRPTCAITTVALLDPHTATHFPHLAAHYRLLSEVVLHAPFAPLPATAQVLAQMEIDGTRVY